MTGLAVAKVLARQIEARAPAVVTMGRNHVGCTLHFAGVERDRIVMMAADPVCAQQLLHRDSLATVRFHDQHRQAVFLGHVTSLDETGRVTITRPQQILARDLRRTPRTPVSDRQPLWVLLKHERGHLRGVTRDVSELGLGLQLEDGASMPGRGSQVEVQIQMVSGRMTVKGRVMNVFGRRCGIRVDDVHAGAIDASEMVSMPISAWSRPPDTVVV